MKGDLLERFKKVFERFHSAEKKSKGALVSSGFVCYVNQSRMCGKGVALILFLLTRSNPSHTNLMKMHIINTYNGVERLHESSFKQ